MPDCLLGIDIGTSACKAVLFRKDGAAAAAAEVPYAVQYPRPGWAEQRPEDWQHAAFQAVRTVLARSGVQPAEVAGVGVDGQSWAMVALDDRGEVLCPSPIWTDTRARAECEEMKRSVGEAALFACSGNPLTPGHTLPKVLWLRKNVPSIFSRAAKVLQSNSYLVYCLTGEMTQDPSQGYGWECFDTAAGGWNLPLARSLGIPETLLPPIAPCSAVVGRVTARAAAETGLLAGTPVVAGGLDAACSTLGVGVVQPGQTQEQGGQAGGMSICLDACQPHPALILSAHVVPGRWLLQGGTTGGGGALKWFREQCCPDLTFEEMSRAAGEAQAGSGGTVFLPYLAGERSPLWNPDAQGVFYGLSFASSRADMIRAVMEGVAYSLRHNLDTAAEAGATVREMRATGGSSRSDVWMQIKADVTGCRMLAPASEHAAARGAAILAGIGVGVYGDWQEAVSGIAIERQYAPDAARHALYMRQYALYRRLAAVLEPVMNETNTERRK